MFKYNTICEEILSSLQERTKKIIICRFGLFGNEKKTLEAVGKDHQVTRERVRQIEKDGIKQIKKRTGEYRDVFTSFENRLDSFGGLKKEDFLVSELAGEGDCENCIVFLLTVSDDIFRVSENNEHHAFWAKDKEIVKKAQNVIDDAHKILKKQNKLLALDDFQIKDGVSKDALSSYLEISKKVIKNEEGLFGISTWPEINPKGIKDKAYLVFKRENKPLHFKEVASLLGEGANPQTTHNELIKDSRFVLVGRGVYALSEWGYIPGEVKEVIRTILEKEGALLKDEIIVRVEEQRIVKKNTIIQNLSNKKYFIRTPDGKYTVA